MKAPYLICLVAGGCFTCAAADDAPSSATLSWVDPDEPSAATVRQVGEQFIDRAGHALVSEAEKLIASQGAAAAIQSVHLHNFPLPKPMAGQPQITALKRTSVALRDPANTPDDGDQAALELIQTAIHDGDPVPRVLVQRVANAGAPLEWRIYRPLGTMPVCLKCHGPVESLAADVREALAKKYPNDHAVGYAGRQWRGLMRVSLEEPAATAKP